MKISKAILLVLMAAAVLPAAAVSENSFTDCVTTVTKTNATVLTLDKVTECQQTR